MRCRDSDHNPSTEEIRMRHLKNRVHAALVTRHAEDGATAVEYGLIIALVAAVIAAAVAALGTSIQGSFQHVTDLIP